MSSTAILIVIGALALALVAWLASVTIDAWRGERGAAPTTGPAKAPGRVTTSAPGTVEAGPAPVAKPAPTQAVAAGPSGPSRGLAATTSAPQPMPAVGLSGRGPVPAGPRLARLDLGRPGSGVRSEPEPTLGRPPEFGGWVEPAPGMTTAQKSVLALVGAGAAYLIWLRLNR